MLALLVFLALPLAGAVSPDAFQPGVPLPQALKRWKLQQQGYWLGRKPQSRSNSLPGRATPNIIQATFTQPLDHFDDKNTFTFEQTYLANAQYYKPGGPVIVVDGGEAGIVGFRNIEIMSDSGIVGRLANLTGGLAVAIEHRYYGNSIPVANFSTDSMRWLTNEQALADSANFMANINFTAATKITDDLRAPNTPWIYYGSSYAGARSAQMKVKYPELVYGAIASSGVVHAITSLWQYHDTIRRATAFCSPSVVKAVETIDISLRRSDLNGPVKELFGLGGLNDADFASVLAVNIADYQNGDWNPQLSSDGWTPICEAVALKPSDPSLQTGQLGNLTVGYEFLNFANYSRVHFSQFCTNSGLTIDQCYSTVDNSFLALDDLSQTWRSWLFQECSSVGFQPVAPPPGIPPIAAEPITASFLLAPCLVAFPPGEHYKLPSEPDNISFNKLADYQVAADRLAIIDGEDDPWRPCTPHSNHTTPPLPARDDTILRPFKLIPGGRHHYDEFMLPNIADEPPQIQAIHEAEIAFVKAWLADFKPPSDN